MESIYNQGINQSDKLKNPTLIRKAFINMLEDMAQARQEAEVSKERTRTALINMLEDLKKSKDILEEKNKELEKALKQLKETTDQLIQTEKIRALGEAMASLSHDIKNILNALEGGIFIMDLGVQKEDVSSIVKGWKMVRRNTDRIRDLVLDMLFYAKPRKPEYQVVEINKIVQEVCELLQNKARDKEVKLEWIPDSSSKQVKVDPKGIYRCLLNLVSNALDACEAGEEVTVKAEVAEEKGFLYIAVSDTGCGIPEDKLKDIFTPFKSSKGYGGTGLGLAVAHKIASEHKGTISVESEVGKGTTFLVRIPLKGEEDSPQLNKET